MEKYDCFPKDPSDNCAIYFKASFGSFYECKQCKQGYALLATTSSCILNTIKDCTYSIKAFDSWKCQTCINGNPNPKFDGCEPFNDPPSGTAYKCLEGGRDIDADDWTAKYCLRCMEGFSLDNNRYCVSTPPTLPGCLYVDFWKNEC